MGLIVGGDMPRKKWTDSGFAERLIRLRKARGLTQVQLARAIQTTQRAISYYETEAGYPPAPVVAKLAQALQVSTDELLGLDKPRLVESVPEDRESRRLWKKFLQVRSLSERDRRAIIRVINSFLGMKGNGAEEHATHVQALSPPPGRMRSNNPHAGAMP